MQGTFYRERKTLNENIIKLKFKFFSCSPLSFSLANKNSLMATNAARYRLVAGKNVELLEFGLRRAQGPDGGLSASKYAYMGWFHALNYLF